MRALINEKELQHHFAAAPYALPQIQIPGQSVKVFYMPMARPIERDPAVFFGGDILPHVYDTLSFFQELTSAVFRLILVFTHGGLIVSLKLFPGSYQIAQVPVDHTLIQQDQMRRNRVKQGVLPAVGKDRLPAAQYIVDREDDSVDLIQHILCDLIRTAAQVIPGLFLPGNGAQSGAERAVVFGVKIGRASCRERVLRLV